MKKFWNQKLERALAFVLSVLLVVNSIPLAGVSIAATNESEESNETARGVSVIYGGSEWQKLLGGIPLTPEMFGVDLTAASKEEDEAVETTTADETSEAAEPVAGDESDDESSATDTTSSADDQGATDTTSSADDQGATETTSSADDQGATETTSSADDQGATETTSSADDQGATDTTSSADDQGATDTTSSADNQSATIASDANDGQNATVESGSDDSQSETEESDSADGQSVVVAPKYADGQSMGENGNSQTSGTSGEAGDESSSSATEESSSATTEDQSEEAEEVVEDVYSYFEVPKQVENDEDSNYSGLIELSGDNNANLKVLSGKDKVGTAIIGIKKNNVVMEGYTYTVTVSWAELPSNIKYKDVNGEFVPENKELVTFKNDLYVSAEGWKVAEQDIPSRGSGWHDYADFVKGDAYDETRPLFFREENTGKIARYDIKVKSVYDNTPPTVAFVSIDGVDLDKCGKLYCYDDPENASVCIELKIEDANFSFKGSDGSVQNVEFYFDGVDKDSKLEIDDDKCSISEDSDDRYFYTVKLPDWGTGKHTLIAKVKDDHGNKAEVKDDRGNKTDQIKLDKTQFQFISFDMTYYTDFDENGQPCDVHLSSDVTYVNKAPRVRIWVKGNDIDKDLTASFKQTWTDVNGKVDYFEYERPDGNDTDLTNVYNDHFTYFLMDALTFVEGEYEITFVVEDGWHSFERIVHLVNDHTSPTLDFSIQPYTGNDSFVENDGTLYTDNAKAVFIVKDQHIDPKKDITILKCGEDMVVGEEISSENWEYVETEEQWEYKYDLAALDEGLYSFSILGQDKAGNKLKVVEQHELDFVKEAKDGVIAIKDVVIDHSEPKVTYCFDDKGVISGGEGDVFSGLVDLVITAEDAYAPIGRIWYKYTSAAGDQIGESTSSDENIVGKLENGLWKYTARFQVPSQELVDAQTTGSFEIFATDILSHQSEKKDVLNVSWDSVHPVVEVTPLKKYHKGVSDSDNRTPTEFCTTATTTDTLTIRITDRDFSEKNLPTVTIGNETLTIVIGEVPESATGKVYVATKEEGGQDGENTWIIDGIVVEKKDGYLPMKIQYHDLAGNLAEAKDEFSGVCMDGYLCFRSTGPTVNEPTWETPQGVGNKHDDVYWIKENKHKFKVNLTNAHSVDEINVILKQDDEQIAWGKCEITREDSKETKAWTGNGDRITFKDAIHTGYGAWTVTVEMMCPDGEYEVYVDCSNTNYMIGANSFKIHVDSTYPEAADPVYDEVNVVRVVEISTEENDEEKDAVWYYGGPTHVTIGAADPTTKIKKLMYEVTDANGKATSSEPIEAKDAEFSDGGKKASVKIDLPKTGEEFDGRIRYWSTNEFDLGEKRENVITTQRIIVDKTNPVFSYKFDKKLTMREGTLFCKDYVNLVLTVEEKYFYPEEVTIIVDTDDEEYIVKEGEAKKYKWTETSKDSGVWTCTLPMKKDTDYNVTVSYHDRSGNPMILGDGMEDDNRLMSVDEKKGEYQFRQVTVDTLSPITCLEIIETPAVSEKNQPEYYTKEDGVKVVAHVFEKHFVPMLVTIDVTANDVEGNEIKIDGEEIQKYYQKLILDPKNWKDGEEDNEHVITLPVSVDARYYMKISCLDPAENQNVYVGESLKNYKNDLDFVLDRTNPDKVLVTYSKQKSGEHGETMYYQDQVKVVLQTKDDISGIREIRYLFIPNGQDGEKSADDLEKSLPNHDFGKIGEGMSAFEATIYLPESALDEKNQLNGYLRVKAVSGSKAETFHVEGTRLVVDNIAPEMVGEMQYNTAHTTKNNKLYFQDTANLAVQILEANFIASDVVLAINDKVEAQTADGWKKDKTNKNLYRHEFNLPAEGDYVIKMTYTDQSGNKMKDYESPTLIVDKTDPVITAEVSAAGAVNEEGGIRYYSSDQNLVVTVREHNFDDDAVKVNITVYGLDGRTIRTEELNLNNFTPMGNDIYQRSYPLNTDGIYEVSASCTDLSGRPSAVYKMNKIAIDKTAPAGLNITYSAPVREASIGGVAYQYYNGPVNVVVSANDDISGVSAFEYRFVRADGTSGVNVSIDTITIGQGQISYGNGNTAATYSFVLPGATLTANGQLNGTLEVRAINRSSLSSEVKDTKRIVADNLAPTLDVTYNDHVKEDGGIWYFNQAISASFSIGEANFYQEDFGFRVTKDGRDIASEIAWSNRPNDKHFGDFALSADGRYEVSMNYADRSGNAAPNYKSKAMIVDTVAPKVTITGISNQMASRDDTIGFVITIEDENLNLDEVTVDLKGVIVNEKGETSRINLSKEVEAQASQDGKSMTVVVTNLEKDAVYTLSCSALDKANNITDAMLAEDGKSYKKMVFSVNRNGSTYLLSEETEKFIGGFSKEPSDIVVTEINPTELKNIKVTLFKNDQTIELVEGTDYQVKKTGSIDTWYQYVYTVDKDVLRDDGVYRMAFYSEDRAGNVSNNTLDNKNVEISFAVDKTIPNVIITNLEEGVTYPVESLTVNIQASDNLKLVRGVAYLDGKECKTWDEQALSAASTGSSALSLDIKDDSVKARTLRVVVTDAAGNETEKVVSGFFVTTNLWIRYVNNKPLLFTSIGVVGVGSPSVAFLFRRRRRRFR